MSLTPDEYSLVLALALTEQANTGLWPVETRVGPTMCGTNGDDATLASSSMLKNMSSSL